jgi:hypothetical protein
MRNFLTPKQYHKVAMAPAPSRDWRRVHHSPLFWLGVAVFMLAMLTYVFSEDLSLRPRRHSPAQQIDGVAATPP